MLKLADRMVSNTIGRKLVRVQVPLPAPVVTCNKKYKNLIKNIIANIQKLLPYNKVSIVNRKDGCIDISCYSNKWEKLLGWKTAKGSKFKQNITIPKWIKNDNTYILSCLKGLIETDGSVYLDKKYKMVNFVTIIPNIASDVMEMISKIGFKSNIQRIKESKNQKMKYTIRISIKTEEFINTVNINKS